MKAIFKTRPFFFISHRGNAQQYPQNTIDSFRSAVELNPETCLEYDLRWTRDKHIVVMHDPHLDGITNGRGLVKDHTLQSLKQLDAGYNYKHENNSHYPYRGKGITIPLFEDVLRSFPDTVAVLHIKVNSIEFIKDVVRIIRKNDAGNRVIIGGFQQRVIDWVRSNAGEIATGFTRGEIIRFLILSRTGLGKYFKGKGDVFLVSEYVNSERPEYRKGDLLQGFRVVTAKFIKDAHKLGYRVFVWTINDKQNMKRLIGMGVDGILTDAPRYLLEVMGEGC